MTFKVKGIANVGVTDGFHIAEEVADLAGL